MLTLLKNGLVCDGHSITRRDIWYDGWTHAESGRQPDAVADCAGLVIMPGLFDMHTHMRDPGQTHKEDIYSGGEAAAAGGVTGLLAMPNTAPPVDSADAVRYVVTRGERSKTHVYTTCCITKGMAGEEILDFSAMKAAGAVAASDDGRPVADARIMRKSLEKAKAADMPVISHCEDLGLIDGGIMNEGDISRELGVRGMTRLSENIITAREILLAAETGARLHIAHVSTKEAVTLLRAFRPALCNITAETAPHYFSRDLTDRCLLSKDADYRMNPPLRTPADILAITSALCGGVIDAIVTDHAPHSPEEKADFETAPNGVVGLETSLAATLTAFYHTGLLPLENIVRLMCVRPREILGLRDLWGGLCVADLNEEWVVDPNHMRSKSRNTCFKNFTLRGKVKYTFNKGVCVYADN